MEGINRRSAVETLQSKIISEALKKTNKEKGVSISPNEAKGVIASFIEWESQNETKDPTKNANRAVSQFHVDNELQSAYKALALNFFNLRKQSEKSGEDLNNNQIEDSLLGAGLSNQPDMFPEEIDKLVAEEHIQKMHEMFRDKQ